MPPRAVTPEPSTRDWAALVARLPLDRATRLVAGQLADRASRTGRVRVDVAGLAAACCVPAAAAADALARLASHQLLARDGRVLVLTRPTEAGAG